MNDTVYRNISSMEPLLPREGRAGLADLCQRIALAVGKLNGEVHSPVVRSQLAALVRNMNCYYSNLIEGHRTLPRDIERAQHQDFSSDLGQRNNQLLAKAHVETEAAMVEQLRREDVDVYSQEFICWLHAEFYGRLPESLHTAKTRSGDEHKIVPGKVRDFMVDIGRHIPPAPESLDAFLHRFKSFYSQSSILPTEQLIAIAAAHHRLAWIHPFGDGNGRVARLHSHALLACHGLDSDGLWTLSRGLARAGDTYYACLQEADRPRENDYDGRGNLSERGLASFCRFFLETILDQVEFMSNLLSLPELRIRIERYFNFEALHLRRHREALLHVVKALIDEGEFPRERVKALTDKGATTAAEIIKLGLTEGYMQSPSKKGVLQIAFPSKVLPFYFPGLFIEQPPR